MGGMAWYLMPCRYGSWMSSCQGQHHPHWPRSFALKPEDATYIALLKTQIRNTAHGAGLAFGQFFVHLVNVLRDVLIRFVE